MSPDVVAVKPAGGYRLWLRFEDGIEGTLDLSDQVAFTGVFEALKDPAYFGQVRVNPEIGTICWPNGADLDPVVLYAAVTGAPLPNWAREGGTANEG